MGKTNYCTLSPITNFVIMPSRSKSKVYFFFLTHTFSLRNRNFLKKFIESIFKKEGKNLYQINYIFCSDKELLSMNKKYLGRNYYTDIITFDLSKNRSEISAEAYISIDRVKKNSLHLGISLKSELYRVIFHGALHLCGYNDKNKKDMFRMRKKENYYLSTYSL